MYVLVHVLGIAARVLSLGLHGYEIYPAISHVPRTVPKVVRILSGRPAVQKQIVIIIIPKVVHLEGWLPLDWRKGRGGG